jgi:hypothetical protein
MRQLTDADVWQLKKSFRKLAVAAGAALLVAALVAATDS